jgi:pyridoxal phosphate enzyme (YggS family)
MRLPRMLCVALAKVDAIGAPAPRRRGRARGAHQTAQQAPACAGRKAVVAEDNAAAGRKPRREYSDADRGSLVAEQPLLRQFGGQGVARAHPPFYRRVASARNARDGTETMSEAADRLAEVNANIAGAAKRAQRRAGEICLIAVSKTHDVQAIRPLIAAGQRHFGENRVQEAAAKWPELRAGTPDLVLHLIGQLQSNKAEEAVALFDAIHSLDRSSLVQAIAKACAGASRQPQLFVQVNIGDEEQKGGCAVADLPALLAEAKDAGLTIAGLMAIPPADIEPAPFFALLDELAGRHGLPLRSMGMSSDYETAVMLGATHLRVGTALFGAR